LAIYSAFTFIEVLFAVILLGIGFIMIAGVFPVAIQQTAAVSDETQSTLIARDAIKKTQAVADAEITGYPPQTAGVTYSVFQPTGGTVQAFSSNIMQAIGNDGFFTGDHRFGWVGFYRRDLASSPFAQVFVIALENPNFANYVTQYQPGETTPITSGSIPPTVAPPIPPSRYNYASPPVTYTPPTSPPTTPTGGVTASITGTFYYNADSSTTVLITYPSGQTSTNGATGAYLLLASGGPANGSMIGRFFRLGNPLAASSLPSSFTPPSGQLYEIYQLQPGSDITPADATANGWTPGQSSAAISAATVFLIGRAPTLSSGTEYTGPFSGPNQDIGVATGFIRVNTANN
jgi:type II secretory pathway pseudopilin PulG